MLISLALAEAGEVVRTSEKQTPDDDPDYVTEEEEEVRNIT